MRKYFFVVISVFIFVWACKTADNTVTPSTPIITVLTCGSVSFSTIATANTAYISTANVPYTGGNGAAYATGSAIASTGVTGLSATLAAGTLATGAGSMGPASSVKSRLLAPDLTATFGKLSPSRYLSGTVSFTSGVGGSSRASLNVLIVTVCSPTTAPLMPRA